MLTQRSIRGVLFDSADVLMRPIIATEASAEDAWRRWFPGRHFARIVRAYHPDVRLDGLDQAIDVGMRYLDERHRVPMQTVDEERELFVVFYRIVLEALGVADPALGLAEELARARVDEVEMEPYPEVTGVLDRLRASGLRLGILSEGWPSLAISYELLGLRSYFDAFVISAQEARLKDDPLMFAVAATRMTLPPAQILFLDDWPPHVQNAIRAGCQAVVVDRAGDAPIEPELSYLGDLHEVERFVLGNGLPSTGG